MAIIHLETRIAAPLERVFDLARSIDAHQDTAEHTGERAVAGVTTGLLGPDEEVTWEARHFGAKRAFKHHVLKVMRPVEFRHAHPEPLFHPEVAGLPGHLFIGSQQTRHHTSDGPLSGVLCGILMGIDTPGEVEDSFQRCRDPGLEMNNRH